MSTQIVISKNPKSKHTNAELPDLTEGTKVTCIVKTKDGKVRMNGIFRFHDKDNDSRIFIPETGQTVMRRNFKSCEIFDWQNASSDKVSNEVVEVVSSGAQQEPNNEVYFDINKRFSFLASLCKMVINNQVNSAIISGSGGLGKSYTVLSQLEIAGLEENIDFIVIKGFSTAKGLYNTLYENSDKLIVFDDCDSVLTNDVARNILKGALDSYKKRVVTWNAQAHPNSEIPTSFEFTGRMIFISNLTKARMPQAIISRAASVDVTMTIPEKIQRMKTVLPFINQLVDLNIKEECMEIVEKFAYQASDLNFRTLLKVISVRMAAEESGDEKEMAEWKDLATYMIIN